MGKGTVEALIREVIKGQGVFFWGVEECFIAAARFLTSLQMSSVDTGVSTPSLLWVNLTLVQPAEKCLCLEKLFMWAGSQIPNVWEEELLHISPRCCNMWIFLPRCVPRSLQKGWKWKTAGMGTWSLCGVEGLEAV